MKNGRIQIQTAEMENKTTNSEKMSKKTVHKLWLKLVKRHYEPPVLLTLISDFPG